MKKFKLNSLAKLALLQGGVQLLLLALGAAPDEACLFTCFLAVLAPLYSARMQGLYRAAFPF